MPFPKIQIAPSSAVPLMLVLAGMGVRIGGAFCMCVLLHELAHAAAAWYLELQVESFSLSWRGARTRVIIPEGKELTPASDLLISVAGPLFSLYLAFYAYMFGWPSFVLCGLITGLCDLIPIPGTDGHRILSALRKL